MKLLWGAQHSAWSDEIAQSPALCGAVSPASWRITTATLLHPEKSYGKHGRNAHFCQHICYLIDKLDPFWLSARFNLELWIK